MHIWGENLSSATNALQISARECQALCVKNPQCVGWFWNDQSHTTSFAPGLCALLRKVQHREKNPKATSGVIRTTPAAAPAQPAAPVQPGPARRTSTFQVGASVDGEILNFKLDVANARACQALCLAQAQCVAWNWYHEAAPPLERLRCFMKRTSKGTIKNEHTANSTAGVIREPPSR